jgi:hypothetical protein
VLTLAVWMGGFTLYGAAVVPILHDELDGLQAGGITRRVTDVLNAVGVATVTTWWVAAAIERRAGPARVVRLRLGLLAMTTAILVGLIALHRVMDRRPDTGGLEGFYPRHRAYLIASTVQWFVNLGLIVTSLVVWGDDRACRRLAAETARPGTSPKRAG